MKIKIKFTSKKLFWLFSQFLIRNFFLNLFISQFGGHGSMTDATIDRLQNFFCVAIRQNTSDLVFMKLAALATLFHVASWKINNWYYPHWPKGKSSWCKFNSDKVNSTDTYKPGPGPWGLYKRSDLCLRTSHAGLFLRDKQNPH